jgi:hypothetical protein
MESRNDQYWNEGAIRGAYPIGFSQDENPRAIPAPPVPDEWKSHAPIFGDLIREVLRLRVQRLYDHKRLSEVTTIMNGRLQITAEITRQQNEVIQRIIDKQDAILQYARSTAQLMQSIMADIVKGQIDTGVLKDLTENIKRGQNITTPRQSNYCTDITVQRVNDQTLRSAVHLFDQAEEKVRQDMNIPPQTGYEQFRDTDYGVRLDPTRCHIKRHPIPEMNEQPWQYDPDNNMKTCILDPGNAIKEPAHKKTREETRQQDGTVENTHMCPHQPTQVQQQQAQQQQHYQQNYHWPQNAYAQAPMDDGSRTIII